MSLERILAIIGGWSVVLVGLSTWLSKLIADRILMKWRLEGQAQSEKLKDTLASNRMLLETASSILSVSQSTAMERRLKAIDALWQSILALREKSSAVIIFYDVLSPTEYDSVLKERGSFFDSIAYLDTGAAASIIGAAGDVETHRPYLGEVLWLLFFAYRAFLGRLAFMLARGKVKEHIPDWREDSPLREILSSALPKEDLKQASKAHSSIGTLSRLQQSLETRILLEMSLLASGRYSSLETLENAKQLQELAASSSRNGT